MRRNEREVTDPKAIEEIINSAYVCRIALCGDGMPYIVPMNYGYSDGCLYLHSASEGKKIDLIRKDNRIGFEIESGVGVVRGQTRSGCTMKYSCVVGFGRALLVQDPEEKVRGLEIIMRQHSAAVGEFPRDLVDRLVLIKIAIEKMTGKLAGAPKA